MCNITVIIYLKVNNCGVLCFLFHKYRRSKKYINRSTHEIIDYTFYSKFCENKNKSAIKCMIFIFREIYVLHILLLKLSI